METKCAVTRKISQFRLWGVDEPNGSKIGSIIILKTDYAIREKTQRKTADAKALIIASIHRQLAACGLVFEIGAPLRLDATF